MIQIALLGMAMMSAPSANVSLNGLIDEMVDLTRLARRPDPWYITAQASSYDRASKDKNTNWFANGDAGQFLRDERQPFRNEHVLADLKGPGTVVRFWSANPAGIVRFYFDGEDLPRIKVPLSSLLGGKVDPMGAPFSYVASNGWNLYFPIPYAKSLKVTVDNTDGDGARYLYYHVDYRTYAPSVGIQSFDWDQLLQAETKKAIAHAANLLTHPDQLWLPRQSETIKANAVVRAGSTWTMPWERRGSGAIYRLRMKVTPQQAAGQDAEWTDPNQIHNILRKTLLRIRVDGEDCVLAPLGDFFVSIAGINVFDSIPFKVSADGWMECRWVMPYSTNVELSLQSLGNANFSLEAETVVGPFNDRDGYRLKAQWTTEHGSTRPMRDMTFLNVQGQGRWLGSNLHVTNPVPDWWGEGDEKVYVDGETFPSIFGTGSEDYYGYAWSSPNLFTRPYHAQTHCDGPGTKGQVCVDRWHVLDDLTFSKSFQFDLEMWHWRECQVVFDRTAYWYSRKTDPGPVAIDVKMLDLVDVPKPAPVKGAIEGESMVFSANGGVAEVQDGFSELSGGRQLWWRNMNPGSVLLVTFKAPRSGTFQIVGNLCKARDYGRHRISINGKVLQEDIDFYSDTLGWHLIPLGTVDLRQGDNVMKVESLGSNPAAVQGGMFGLDYLLLKEQSR